MKHRVRAATAPRTAGKPMGSHPGAGFTLIELLVVIAIIAILAAILFPVFAQAREKARQAACLSNTKQIALGIQMYAQDFDEVLPVGGYNAQRRGRWQWQIFPYVKNEQVFTCPNLANWRWRAPTTPGALGTNDKGGYGWNYALSQDGAGAATPGYSLAAIAKPADTIIVGDTGYDVNSNAASGWAMMAADPRNDHILSFTQPGLYAQFRHNTSRTRPVTAQGITLNIPVEGRANFSFLDGHSKSLSVGQAFATSTTNPPTEDGATLVREPSSNHQRSDIEYFLWNRY